MSSGWTLVGDLVKLIDTTDTVLVGPGSPSLSPPPKLEVVGNALLTLQDKGGNVYDVKAYGAKGDGASDDLPKIQDAVAALRAGGGGTLYFPPGRYVVSNEIVIDGYNIGPPPAGQALPFLVQGAGPQATILLSSSLTANTIRTTYGGAVALGREICMEIRDLMFGATVTKTGGDAIRQECAPEFQNTFLVRNCWFRDVYNGVHLTAIGSAIIKDCVVVNPKNAAIFLELFYNGGLSDVGTVSINDNYFFRKGGGTGVYGVWATTGVSGLRVCNNYFLNFDHQLLIAMIASANHTQVLVDGNAFDGTSAFPKLQITGLGTLSRFAISNNRFTGPAPAGIQVDVTTDGINSGTVQRGAITDNVVDLQQVGTGTGLVLNPTSSKGVREVLVSGNAFSNVGIGIQIGAQAFHIFLSENAFEASTMSPTLVSNSGEEPRGAFFPDRLGVGRINDVKNGVSATVKEIYAYSNQTVRPRVYLEGVAGTSSPGIDFAFDHSNTRRVGIVGTAVGGAGAQLEFFTKPDSGTITTQRAILDSQGHFVPAADGVYKLGSATQRWADVFAVAKHSVLNTSFGSGVTLVPVLEGPEYLLYDTGTLTLEESGEAFVNLDPCFVEIVNTDLPYRVLTSGCKVKEKESKRFRVKGDPGDVVDWMVVAVRAGFENVRFRDAADAEPVGQQDPEHAVARKNPENHKT